MTREKPLVLIADDEPMVADTLVQIFNEEGFDAVSVSDGDSAVLWAHNSRPEVVILDVMMPKLNGVEAAKQIATILPQVHIILFSGQAAAGELVDKTRAEGQQFTILAKPVKPEMLLQLIARMTSR
jgi:DNA-binding NtrC family response regulator